MSRHSKKIYVEIDIRGPIDRIWNLTQTPDLHQRWDLRFTEINYLPRIDAAHPQRFLYATRIGFGLNIRGEGESLGSSVGPALERSSALRFWSDDRKSLIREGSGYWKYVPRARGGEDGRPIRFLTQYDYDVRFGVLGRFLDRVLFRWLIGWATAWSFDRLRLWIEKDIDPGASMRHSLVYLVARLALALVWIYQGIVPKLVFRHPDELMLLRTIGLTDSATRGLCVGIGCVEVAIGLTLILAWRFLAPLWLTLVAMPAALLVVMFESPEFMRGPFNPVSLNIPVFALALIALLLARDLPSAGHCVRNPPQGEA